MSEHERDQEVIRMGKALVISVFCFTGMMFSGFLDVGVTALLR